MKFHRDITMRIPFYLPRLGISLTLSKWDDIWCLFLNCEVLILVVILFLYCLLNFIFSPMRPPHLTLRFQLLSCFLFSLSVISLNPLVSAFAACYAIHSVTFFFFFTIVSSCLALFQIYLFLPYSSIHTYFKFLLTCSIGFSSENQRECSTVFSFSFHDRFEGKMWASLQWGCLLCTLGYLLRVLEFVFTRIHYGIPILDHILH